MSKLRRLGQTDLYVSALGLGTWQYSTTEGKNGAMWQNVESETIYDIIKFSLQNGINWLDTAEIYGNGTSEKFIGNTLQRLKKEEATLRAPLIASKWFPLTIGQQIQSQKPLIHE